MLGTKLMGFWWLLLFCFTQPIFAQTVTIPAGSKIIDMGITPQTVANALKPYGLVYQLLNNKTPVMWSINPSKVKDGIDFTIGTRNFRGGPFIVQAQYVS